MKCLYYLAPTLVSAHHISDDLHDAGIDDWFFHIMCKDEAGLKKAGSDLANTPATVAP